VNLLEGRPNESWVSVKQLKEVSGCNITPLVVGLSQSAAKIPDKEEYVVRVGDLKKHAVLIQEVLNSLLGTSFEVGKKKDQKPEKIDTTGWLPGRKFAKEAKVPYEDIIKLIRSEDLPAKRWAKGWLIDPKQLERIPELLKVEGFDASLGRQGGTPPGPGGEGADLNPDPDTGFGDNSGGSSPDPDVTGAGAGADTGPSDTDSGPIPGADTDTDTDTGAGASPNDPDAGSAPDTSQDQDIQGPGEGGDETPRPDQGKSDDIDSRVYPRPDDDSDKGRGSGSRRDPIAKIVSITVRGKGCLISEVASDLGLPVSTVREWVARGAVKTKGDNEHLDERSLEEFLIDNGRATTVNFVRHRGSFPPLRH